MRRSLTCLAMVLGLAAVALPFGGMALAHVDSERVWVEEELKRFPTIDTHIHLSASEETYALTVKAMDSAGIAISINLSGGTGERLEENLKLGAKHPGRFIQFCGVDHRALDWSADDIGEQIAASIQESYDKGARGFGEIGKWGLRGTIDWDDERLEPMWDKLVELEMPINWHVSEPTGFWRAESPRNTTGSFTSYYRKRPLKQTLLHQQERVLERHPDLIVIACHSNWLTDSVPLLEYRFDKYPNYYIDISASVGEWGAASDEFVHVCREYSDRILYGTDMSCRRIGDEEEFETKFLANVTAFHIAHFLFLGTSQKMIPTPFSGNKGKHFVGRAYGGPLYANDGVALPDGILEKIYYKNSERLFGIRAPAMTRPAAEE